MKTQLRNVVLVLAGMIIGCASGLAGPSIARAQWRAVESGDTRWEQRCESISNLDDASVTARRLGAEGWELATMNAWALCFKRHGR
jgi:hypothetical protein